MAAFLHGTVRAVEHALQYGPGPKSTMLADGASVYSFGIRERLLALDAKTGAVQWEKSFEDIYDPPYPEWGTAASPLLEGDLLIVPIGNTTEEQERIISLRELWLPTTRQPARRSGEQTESHPPTPRRWRLT